MGKKGALLRQMKAQQRTYTFTAQQLAERDQKLKEEVYKLHQRALLQEEKRQMQGWREAIIKEWDERAKEFPVDDMNETFMNATACMFAIACRVLIEQFNWMSPLKGGRKMRRFAQAMTDELNKITDDSKIDIRHYAKEVDELYGLKFISDFIEG